MMHPETARRLATIFEAVKQGTSPLTAQDISEAMLVGFIPIDAPSLSLHADLEETTGSSGRQAGPYVGGVCYEIIVRTLEEKIARKQTTNRKED